MTRSPWWSRTALVAVTMIVFAACGGTTSTASPSAGAATPVPSAPESVAPYEGMTYPESGEAPCGTDGYTGNVKRISATDASTVVFELCNPDVAFLPKVAFSPFAINDTAWLESKIDPAGTTNQAIVSEVNGTGPYKLDVWNRGSDVTMVRNDAYWGEKAKTEKLIMRWSQEGAQRLVELQSGAVDGIDNVGNTDFPTVEANADLQIQPREGLNVMYFGFNNAFKPFDDVRVRQAIALGIDRERLLTNFAAPGSEIATHFTPCSIPNGCEGEAWGQFDVAAARALLAEAGFADGFKTKIIYRDVSRGYVNDQNVIAVDLQAQLKTNLNIDASIEVQESATFIDNADAGKLDGIHILGWGADYPDVTNFLDYHFGSGATAQFGAKFDDITGPLSQGAIGTNDANRAPFYEQANNAIKANVPMVPIWHQASATAYRADVEGAHSSPLSNEHFASMTPGTRTQIVFMQGAEPPGLYCADESDGEALRVCEQMMEGLYAFEIAGTAAIPALAETCEPNAELTVWTCTLRSGVTFHDGATLDANDVVLSYAVQWDAAHPLHKGRDGSFSYFPGLFGGFLNPPPAAE
ncbi:MAG: peptide ABC transporter substrate-binding protein [Chloroflexi bacterium RBG_16_72_14]|nr:MAG: peptide ABC transporter substrate-binding protein [Chloroflexi bacterium RBG_16_72_14]